MHKDWPEMARELTGAIKEVRLGAPEVMKAFSTMAQAATAGGALDTKTKELIALAIAVAIRCDGKALPFVLARALFGLAITGLGISIWPDVIPARVTIWEAAAPARSQWFMLIGAGIMVPIILPTPGGLTGCSGARSDTRAITDGCSPLAAMAVVCRAVGKQRHGARYCRRRPTGRAHVAIGQALRSQEPDAGLYVSDRL